MDRLGGGGETVSPVAPTDERATAPLRAEFLSADRLAARAARLAEEQRWSAVPQRGTPLLRLVSRAAEQLSEFNRLMAEFVRRRHAISPATEWLLDNFYLIDEQVTAIHEDLPRGFGRELPWLTSGPYERYPRVFEAAVTLIEHTDARLERDQLVRFVNAYQEVSPFRIGELWAVPIMLRVGLVENLRRLSLRVAEAQRWEMVADEWADRILLAAQERPQVLADALEDLYRSVREPGPTFLLRMSQRIQAQEPELSEVTAWVDRHVEAAGKTLEPYAVAEHARQAADQVSIANSITSIRLLSALDWRAFFEDVSVVERTLREDPAAVYARMDFPSRDRYRDALEHIARRSEASEHEIARAVVEAARAAVAEDPADCVRGHVGWYLIAGGRYSFEPRIGFRPALRNILYRSPLMRPGGVYAGLLVGLTAALALSLVAYMSIAGASTWAVALVTLLALTPLSDAALHMVNRVMAVLWAPRRLPKLDFEAPVPDEHRTLVVVPALLSSVAAVRSVLDNLEVHLLANRDSNIHFALLGDLKAAPEERVPADDPVIETAIIGIAQLNERYFPPPDGPGPFHLFIRRRTYNEAEGAWMGWERKRGALTDLNRLLRGQGASRFLYRMGDDDFLLSTTFVLTLDADTVLPRDAAKKLIGTISHPLNRAQYDEETHSVARGYGLIQPRVAMSLPMTYRSRYARLFAGPAGIDPYAFAASDVYQDAFGEGSFTGKGVYEVNVFRAILEPRIPENTLLSHDLLEGSYVRTGLAADISVVDDYPTSYMGATSRQHRWVRGDWQTLPWLMPTVPRPGGKRAPNDLSRLGRWKLADNLRRALVAPSTVAFLAAGFALTPGPGLVWIAVLLGIVLFPVYLHFTDAVLSHPKSPTSTASFRSTWRELLRDNGRALFSLAVLPHQAYVNADAAVRALYRMAVSRRHLLEWETAAETETRTSRRLPDFLHAMWSGTAVAVAAVAPGLILGGGDPVAAGLLLALWLSAPFEAYWTSRPPSLRRETLDERDRAFARHVARKTWRFFESFVTAEDHWLAPDNFQEEPKGEVAHRTSPTNVGMQLLATVAAHDLGYLGLSELVARVSRTLQSMAGLERFRGHFYNWYDTTTLQPLRPGYVSTVDSGNLAGHLVAVRAGLLEASERPLVGPELLDGLADSLRLALEDLHGSATNSGGALRARERIEELLRRTTIEEPPGDLPGWWALLGSLSSVTESLPALLEVEGVPERLGPCAPVVEEVRGHLRDLRTYAPWAPLAGKAPDAVLRTHGGDLAPLLDLTPSLVGLAEGLTEALEALRAISEDPPGSTAAERRETAAWALELRDALVAARPHCIELLARTRLMADIASEMWRAMDFTLLYDASRELFSIGFNTAEGRVDNSYYDLLASEARLASFLAIAKGDVPQEHWFRLGRLLTPVDGGHALVSWSASMFEYLMPLLVMPTWPGTILDDTYRAVVRRQVEYGRERGVPWGVSESAFNAKDVELTYQYQAFGVPGLGLKRGLSEDVVVAPYATALAVVVLPRTAVRNLRELQRQGAEGRYGFYESVDYTPGRVPAGKERALVRAYFAHHQGMSLVSLCNEVLGGRMTARFLSDPVVQSAELLLQERVPRHIVTAKPHVEEVEYVRSLRELPPPVVRSYPLADTPVPATHFLSNGRYSVMVTNAGGGYSRWEDLAVTRYREDVTRDCWGTFFYVRDLDTGHTWSPAFQPTRAGTDDYHVIFSPDKAEFRRRDGEVETHMELVVSPEDDVEVRRITLTNHGRSPISLDVTSYLEVALAPHLADRAHRAFSNLFVETEHVAELDALFFTRRPRSAAERRVWGVHVLACEAGERCECTYETDRSAFLGRLHGVYRPQALYGDGELTGTVGPAIDPVCSIRQKVVIAPGETARIAYTTGVARTREEARVLAERYHDVRSAQRALDLSWTSSQIQLRDLGITPDEAVVFQRLASRLLLTDPYSPLKAKTRVENGLPISALWGLGISGDVPILLVEVERLDETPLVRQALLAHQYWRHQGLVSDLVVLNTSPTGYGGDLEERLRLLVRTGHALQLMDRPGGIFLRRADQIHPDVLNLLRSVARARLVGEAGPLLLQLNQRGQRPELPDPLFPRREPEPWPEPPFQRPALAFDNGYGGFDPSRDEYVVVMEDDRATPAPWINVMATPGFGCYVSEAGIGCTWALNSHENRLTTWNNDAVTDGSGESLYLRDEETGEFWSPTPRPRRGPTPYLVRHGRGYTVFEHASHGVRQEVTWFVAREDPVRVVRVRLTNLADRPRRLTATHVVEWVLGDSRSAAQQRVVTWYDPETDMLTAHNHFNADFPGRPAFLAADRGVSSFTGSRTEFLGRNGVPSDPAAMHRKGLGAQTGRFHDNCGALQVHIDLEPGETQEVSFLLGQTDDLEQAREAVARYREEGAVEAALRSVEDFWRTVLGTVRISTPDPQLDTLVNTFVLYQTLSCRIWGRTALYQSSGAYGFRDQLQDVMPLNLVRPEYVREQVLEAARHQFEHGDVLHWWMPRTGRGVRTRITDDRHWLPLVLADYLRATGDWDVLDVSIPFITGPEVEPPEEDVYMQPAESESSATLYEHCCRALDSARETGLHGLPLMGGGDWNDGMNRVGIEGRGESVWLAWFLVYVLGRFAPVCRHQGEEERARDYEDWARELAAAADANAWDGAWYRRAYFDDGTPLGTQDAEECRIDAVAQAWAVICGQADPKHSQRAMSAVEEHLVRWEDGLLALLEPPFDKMEHDPGYIKGYVPGVRENGGQYTHAAIWVALAYLITGEGDEGVALLDLINPVNHTSDKSTTDLYRVEPYVVAADVYASPPHVGRGGWTWYTGSAGWFWQVAVMYVLGIRRIAEDDGAPWLVFEPCVPKRWPRFGAEFTFGSSTYDIVFENPRGVNRGVARVVLDGTVMDGQRIPLVDDGARHEVRVAMLGG